MKVPETLSAGLSRGSHRAAPPAVSLCVVLAGGIKTPPLARAAGRSVLDVWVSPSRTVLGAWVDRVREAWSGVDSPETDPPEMVVVHGGPGSKPEPHSDLNVRVRDDDTEFRGPAGAVRDAANGQDSASFVLVIEGASFLRSPLNRLFCDPAESASAVVGINADGSPAGLYLIRRELLDLVPPIGFIDLKEQLLRQAKEAGHRIVVRDMGPSAFQRLKTRRDLLAATRPIAGGLGSGPGPEPGPGPEAWKRGDRTIGRPGLGGGCICEGASVAEDALMIDSVVMPGAVVGSRAVVVRSILFEGARVEAGEIVLDQMVAADGRSGSGRSGPTGEVQT